MAACWESSASRRWSRRPCGIKIRRFTFPTHRVVDLFLILIVLAACFHWVSLFELVVSDAHSCRPYIRWIPPQSADKGLLVSLVTPFVPEAYRSPVMPMHSSPSIDTDLSRAETVGTPYIVLFACLYQLRHRYSLEWVRSQPHFPPPHKPTSWGSSNENRIARLRSSLRAPCSQVSSCRMPVKLPLLRLPPPHPLPRARSGKLFRTRSPRCKKRSRN